LKAIVYQRYGPPEVLQCAEVLRPAPKEGEVLLRVHAAAANPIDWHFMRGMPRIMRLMTGLTKPRVPQLGFDVAGDVVAVGKGVIEFKPGDAVFGAARGTFAEFTCAPAKTLMKKPARVTFVEAGSVAVAGLTALQALRDKGRLQPGQKVLINGAAGGVGTFAVQIARVLDAEVTGVCSTRNVEFVRSMGAAAAIDYTREDFTTGSARYDLIVDCVGNHPFAAIRRVLVRTGTCVMVGAPNEGLWLGPMATMLRATLRSRFTSQRFVGILAQIRNADLALLQGWMQDGRVTPVVDRCYPLAETAGAIRYLETGHARGKVVVTNPD
jgi:NADPH:quinone reductase-like Zn-dependent oxidoreductase